MQHQAIRKTHDLGWKMHLHIPHHRFALPVAVLKKQESQSSTACSVPLLQALDQGMHLLNTRDLRSCFVLSQCFSLRVSDNGLQFQLLHHSLCQQPQYANTFLASCAGAFGSVLQIRCLSTRQYTAVQGERKTYVICRFPTC